MERAIYFDKFRNIGLEKRERLVLNNSLEKGKLGNLVILIGPNNSGKSNVLDGLRALGNKKIYERDVTTLSFEDEYSNPQLSFEVKDDLDHYAYFLSKNNGVRCSLPNYELALKYDFSKNPKEVIELLCVFEINCKNYGQFKDSLSVKFNNIKEYYASSSVNYDADVFENQVFELIKDYFKSYGSQPSAWNNFANRYENTVFVEEIRNKLKEDNKTDVDRLQENFYRKYGFNFFPQIINYQEKNISSSELKCSAKEVENAWFIKLLFDKIGIDCVEIKRTYDSFRVKNNKGALTTLQKKINKRIEIINNDFNNMYYARDDKYTFEISLETDYIYFTLYRGNNDIVLDYQSTGFKWFFNLYFGLLSNKNLNPGDIIIMDEPATNLHVLGQKELRAFLKGFAIKNDLTIVLATHSPFLIDLDYLDELRVVSMSNNVSSISNNFASIDEDDPDSLKPVKEALTINNHVVINPDNLLVFVEGITDYNYLLGLKNKLKIQENIVFLPIKGVGKNGDKIKEKQAAISSELLKIRKNNTILLVDGDKAGKSMQSVNKDSDLTVITLSDIDASFKTIESLFDFEDIKALKLVNGKGEFIKNSASSLIKTFIDRFEFRESTLNNFKKLFEYILNL